MTSTYQHLRLEANAPLSLTVWLDVEGRSVNALSDSIFEELESLLDQLAAEPGEKAVVFRSGKPTSFIVGADLKKIASLDSVEETERLLGRGQRLFDRLRQLPQATIAAIHGPCLGGGLEFALACDWRFARDDPKTQLGLPETKLGLIPGWGGTQDLPRLVGLPTGLKLLISGESVDPADALRLGLIDGIGSAASFEEDLQAFVLKISDPSSHPRRGGGLFHWLARRFPFSWSVPDELPTDALRGPAIQTLLEVVRAGWPARRDKGLAAERSRFYSLVSSPAVQAELARFFKPKPPAQA